MEKIILKNKHGELRWNHGIFNYYFNNYNILFHLDFHENSEKYTFSYVKIDAIYFKKKNFNYQIMPENEDLKLDKKFIIETNKELEKNNLPEGWKEITKIISNFFELNAKKITKKCAFLFIKALSSGNYMVFIEDPVTNKTIGRALHLERKKLIKK